MFSRSKRGVMVLDAVLESRETSIIQQNK